MRYEITGGIEKGIHYTQFTEKVEGEDSQGGSMQPKEGAQKSHGEKDSSNNDGQITKQ